MHIRRASKPHVGCQQTHQRDRRHELQGHYRAGQDSHLASGREQTPTTQWAGRDRHMVQQGRDYGGRTGKGRNRSRHTYSQRQSSRQQSIVFPPHDPRRGDLLCLQSQRIGLQQGIARACPVQDSWILATRHSGARDYRNRW